MAAVSQAMMFSGVYPLLPHALRVIGHRGADVRPVRSALAEWGMSVGAVGGAPGRVLAAAGGATAGPRPIIVLHGYAMNRANFVPLAFRLARAGLGPIFGFEYWTLGRIAAGARQLGWFVDEVRARTGATRGRRDRPLDGRRGRALLRARSPAATAWCRT